MILKAPFYFTCFTVMTGLSASNITAAAPKESLFITAGVTLSLNNDEPNCRLVIQKNEESTTTIPLLLSSPCYWVSAETSPEPLQYSYPKLNAESTLLVSGTTLDWPDSKKEYFKLPTDTHCSQFLQGVVISNQQIHVTGERMEAPHCQGLAVDEKVFLQAATIENRYQEDSTEQFLNKIYTDVKNNEQPDTLAPAEKPETTNASEETPHKDSLLNSIQKTLKSLFSPED